MFKLFKKKKKIKKSFKRRDFQKHKETHVIYMKIGKVLYCMGEHPIFLHSSNRAILKDGRLLQKVKGKWVYEVR